MNKRDTVLALFALAAPLRLRAQPARGAPRVGILLFGTPALSGYQAQALIEGMAELGYHDGKNVHYEFRRGDGSNIKVEQNARELVAAQVDLIWTPGGAAVTALQRVTATLPIVFSLVSDPVAMGFVRSLPRPGTNATGISLMTAEMGAKRIEILNEAFPKIRRFGFLSNPDISASAVQLPFVQQGVRALGKELMVVEARAAEEFAAAFDKLAAWRADGLIISDNSLYFQHRNALMNWAATHRWVTISPAKEYAEAGGTIAYGADYVDNCRRSAVYVDKILKGAKPTDLPVQQPTKFELVINLKAAKALGLSIPQSILVRADRVIE